MNLYIIMIKNSNLIIQSCSIKGERPSNEDELFYDISDNNTYKLLCVFDGHGGHKCAEYLKDNLHNNIIL